MSEEDIKYQLQQLFIDFNIQEPPNFYEEFMSVLFFPKSVLESMKNQRNMGFLRALNNYEKDYHDLKNSLETALEILKTPLFRQQLSFCFYKNLNEDKKDKGAEEYSKKELDEYISGIKQIEELLNESQDRFTLPKKKPGPQNKNKLILASNLGFLMIHALEKFPTTTQEGFFERLYLIACEEIGISSPGDTDRIMSKTIKDLKQIHNYEAC